MTDTNGIYGAAFRVTYDAAAASFTGWSHGSFLESGGHTPTYQVDDSQPGILYVAATRNGNVPSLNAQGTRNLINLTFRVEQAGLSPVAFDQPILYDGRVPPQPLPGVQWFGGSLGAN